MTNLYETLEVDPSASLVDIKKAYRRLVMTCHPDKFPDNPEKNLRFKELTAAYDVLMDEERKALYDKTGIYDLNSDEFTIYKNAERNLVHLFMSIFEAVSLENVGQLDIKSTITANVRQNIRAFTVELNVVKNDKEKFEKIKKRLKITKEDDLLMAAIDSKIRDLDTQIKHKHNSIKVGEQVLVLLEHYEYNSDKFSYDSLYSKGISTTNLFFPIPRRF